ncbi:MAG: hypothetical protein ACI8QC_003862 [Planctomycetota bacterium]|jgi:hypothetical protein
MRLRSPILLLLAASAIVLALVLRGMGLGIGPGVSIALAAERQSIPAPEPAPADLADPKAEPTATQTTPASSSIPIGELPIDTARRSSANTAPAAPKLPSAHVEVRVISAATGTGLAGVRVVVFLENRPDGRAVPDRPSDGNQGKLGSSALTDAQGFVDLHVPADAALRLSLVDEAGVGAHASHAVSALQVDELRQLELPLERGSKRYFLSVLASADRSPIPDASASFAERLTPASSQDSRAGRTDPEGLLTVSLNAGRTDWLWVRAPGYAPQRIRIGPGHDSAPKARELVLVPSSSLRLQLLATDGAPIAKVQVEISTDASNQSPTPADSRGCAGATWTAETNPQGWAHFEGLVPDAPLTVKITPTADYTWPKLDPLVLSPEEGRELVLRHASGTKIEGQLIAHGEVPIAGLELWLLPADEPTECLLVPGMGARAFARTVSDEQGHYQFADVPAGTWWLGPAPRRKGHPDAIRPAPRAAWIRVPEACEHLKLDLDIHPALWLTGRVLTAKGFSAGRQRLWAKPIMGGDGLSAWTDSAGRFRMGPVPTGTYELAVDAAFAHAGSSPLVLDAGADPVEIRLRAGASIIGLAFDPEGVELEPLSVLITCSDGQVIRSDCLDIEGLPDGTHGLFVRSAAGRVGIMRGLVANAGHRPTEVLVTLGQAAELRLHVMGQYRLWSGGVCVGLGEATEDAPLVLLAPAGSARLERVGETQRTSLELVAGKILELGR